MKHFLAALCAAGLLSAVADLFGTGEWHQDGKGTCSIDIAEGGVEVRACWIDPRWGTTVADGALKAYMKDGALRIEVAAKETPGRELNKEHPMMVRISGNAASYLKGELVVGNAKKSFEKSFWGWGSTFYLSPLKLGMRFSSAVSVNYVVGDGGSWQLRAFLKPGTASDGLRLFEGTLTISQSASSPKPVSPIIEQKRTQYTRVLSPPQEMGLDTTRWLDAISSDDASQQTFGLIEDLLDARSRLYSAAERMSCRPTRDTDGEALVASGYKALNGMDHAAATGLCARIEARLEGSEKWMPYGSFCPFNWVKCFTQWGYMRALDGCSVSEPNPWLIQWQDGFRMNLAQDSRVVIANTAENPRFYQTRYLKPMSDVKFERSWVDTRWLLPDKTVTFSVLTPIIDVDGVETLTISGLPSEPLKLRCVGRNGQSFSIPLVRMANEEPQVVASVLMDFKAPPPAPRTWSSGEQKIDPESVDRPYAWLVGKDWSLALFPGARPVSASWTKGVFSLKLERRSWVGVMRLKDNLHEWEQPEVCEFFAKTALAYPKTCRSVVSGQNASWTYSHVVRENAWGTKPHVLAPVPPLLDYADISVPGSRAFKYPTKWGLFRYCEGDTVSCVLPDLRPGTVLRGVNVGLWDDDSVWKEHAANGAKWVRAVFGGKKTLEENLSQLDRRLSEYGDRMRFLVDPHGKLYKVEWAAGMVHTNDDVFVKLWDEISRVGARHAEAIEGYDLYNEPGIVAGSEGRWRDLCARAARAIHANHPGAKVYYPGIYGGNPNGLFNLEPLPEDCEPQAVTYHFYSPHAFTHQKVQTHNRGGDTCVFYPAWSAPIDWKAGSHFGGTTVDWYDRWTLAAILLPAYEHYAQYRRPLHVGEFGVIGYANAKSPWSACLWTRDAVELVESNGASWNLWNGGFGLGNIHVRKYIYDLWRKDNASESSRPGLVLEADR